MTGIVRHQTQRVNCAQFLEKYLSKIPKETKAFYVHPKRLHIGYCIFLSPLEGVNE